MGVMDKFKNLVGVVDDDEIENEYVEPSEADKRVAEVQKASEGIARLCLCQEEI